MLCLPVLASFADSKLLDFPELPRVEKKPLSSHDGRKLTSVLSEEGGGSDQRQSINQQSKTRTYVADPDVYATVPDTHAQRVNNTYIPYIARDTRSIYM